MKKIITLLFVMSALNIFSATYTVKLLTDNHSAPVGGVAQYNNTPNELRWAIYQANLNPGKDIINFDFGTAPTFPQVITLKNGIAITEVLEINGDNFVQGLGSYSGSETRVKVVLDYQGAKTSSFSYYNGTTTVTYPDYSSTSLFSFYNTLVPSGTIFSRIENLTFNSVGAVLFGSGIRIEHSTKIIVKNCIFDKMITGIFLAGNSDKNIIQSCYFGTDKNFTIKQGELSRGIDMFQFQLNGTWEYPDDNTIGGGLPADKNYFYNINISTDGAQQIGVSVRHGDQNNISHNIFVNCEKNISLYYPTCNTSNAGASNMCKNFPSISSAIIAGTTLTVKGMAKLGDKIDIYKTNSTNVDAVMWLGSVNLTSNNSFTFTNTNTSCKIGEKLIATSTESKPRTSEFTPLPIEITGCKSCSTPPSITIPAGNLNANVNLTFSASAGVCNFNNPTVWVWNYGDNTPSTSSNVHSYAATGTYTVQYSVPASNGCPAIVATKTVTIVPSIQTACNTCSSFTFYYPSKRCKGEKITFESYIAGCGKPVTTLPVWTYGDGSPASTDPSHTYTQAGTYSVIMSVPGFCTTSKTISIIDCPEFSCNPALPCNSLGLSDSIFLVSSTITNTTVNGEVIYGGTYQYRARAKKTGIYNGTYSYAWNIQPSHPTITYSLVNDSTMSITKTNNAIPMTVSVEITATTSPYTGCKASTSLDPCENFSADIDIDQAFRFSPNPNVKFSVATTANTINPSGTYAYYWWMNAPIPPTATPTTATTNTISISNIANNPSNANNNELNLQMRVKVSESANNSNGCVSLADLDLMPCNTFNPTIDFVSYNNTTQTGTYKVTTNGSSTYSYSWSLNIISNPINFPMQIVGSNSSQTVQVKHPTGNDCGSCSVELIIIVTDNSGIGCKKRIVRPLIIGN